jgi:DNA-directed RNA polymerase specialized sigma24 family protein
VIRAGLIRIFVSKGFSDAEDLGDETINRVMKKLPEIQDTYIGEPARYFHGVARYIIREVGRRKEVAVDEVPVFSIRPDVHSNEYDCLVKCLKFLPPEKRELILDYYIYDGRDKIAQHRHMASELGITEGALRGRAHHVRGNLEKCIEQCTGLIKSNES